MKSDIGIKSFVTWTKRTSTCFAAMHKAVCFYTYLPLSSCTSKKKRGIDVNDLSSLFQLLLYTSYFGTAGTTNMLVIHPSTLISPLDLALSLSLGTPSAGNEVCVCVVCLLPKSLRPITGFWSDCVAAIISSCSGPDCQLNTQIVVVNSGHL